jgi:hypothetical protein
MVDGRRAKENVKRGKRAEVQDNDVMRGVTRGK